MNKIDTSLKSKTKTRSPKSPTIIGIERDIILEESKAGDRDRLIGDTQHSEESSSEDVELEDLSEEEGLQDDEETGLTGKDKKRRKRKRRRNTLMDQRVAAEVTITAEEKKEADQNVVKNLLINSTLIGLWYLFSLSISIVSPCSSPESRFLLIYGISTTSGCLTPNISISISRYLQPACTCSCSSLSHHSSSSYFPNSDLDTTLSRIHIIHIRTPSYCNMRRNPKNL